MYGHKVINRLSILCSLNWVVMEHKRENLSKDHFFINKELPALWKWKNNDRWIVIIIIFSLRRNDMCHSKSDYSSIFFSLKKEKEILVNLWW